MRHIFNLYIDGKLKSSHSKEKEFDWDWLDIHYDGKIAKLKNKGYENIYQSMGGKNGYTVLLNKKSMHSKVIGYDSVLESDFKDVDGCNIITDVPYYMGNSTREIRLCENWNGGFYLRANYMRDIDVYSQEDVDGFELHR